MDYIAWRAGGSRVRLCGHEVFVRIAGTGTPLLFLHGFPTTSYDFDEVIAALETRWQCISFDFAGFGDSEPPLRYSYDHQTELALAVAAHAGIRRAIVVAHDYGVSVAQELLARRPEALALDGVVFLNGGLEPALHRALFIQRLLAGPLGAVIAPLLVRRATFTRSLQRVLTRPERFDFEQHWEAVRARGAHLRAHELLHYIAERRVRRTRWVESFADRSTPVGLVWGARDPVSGEHVLDWARSARPDAEVLSLPVGHYPQVESPAEVAAFIDRFARSHTP